MKKFFLWFWQNVLLNHLRQFYVAHLSLKHTEQKIAQTTLEINMLELKNVQSDIKWQQELWQQVKTHGEGIVDGMMFSSTKRDARRLIEWWKKEGYL